MMRREEEYDIDGHKFRITTLPSGEGNALMLKLISICTPAFAALTGGSSGKEGGILDMEVAAVIPLAAEKLSSSLDSADFEKMLNTLASQTQYQLKPGDWIPLNQTRDELFSGALDLQMKWLMSALMVNYGSFLVEGGGIADYANTLLSKQKANFPKKY